MPTIAIIAAIAVLISYAAIDKYGSKQFDVANAVCFLPIAIVAFEAGAFGSALISLCFGVIALWRVSCRLF